MAKKKNNKNKNKKKAPAAAAAAAVTPPAAPAPPAVEVERKPETPEVPIEEPVIADSAAPPAAEEVASPVDEATPEEEPSTPEEPPEPVAGPTAEPCPAEEPNIPEDPVVSATPEPEAVPAEPEPELEDVAPVDEETPVVEEAPVEPTPIVEETPVVDDEPPAAAVLPVVEDTPVVEEKAPVEVAPVIEETPVVEEAPVEAAPIIIEEPPAEALVKAAAVIEETPVVKKTPVVETSSPVVEETPVIVVEEPPTPVKKTASTQPPSPKGDDWTIVSTDQNTANDLNDSYMHVEKKEAYEFMLEALRAEVKTGAQDGALLAFLRWKPDVTRASKRFRAHLAWRAAQPALMSELLLRKDKELVRLLSAGVVVTDGALAKDDSAVLLTRFGKADPTTDVAACRAVLYAVDRILEEHESVTIVHDLKGLSRPNAAAFPKITASCIGAFPLRVKAVYIVNQPWWFTGKAATKLMSPKLVARTKVLKKPSGLVKAIAQNQLMEEYGGSREYQAKEWVALQMSREADGVIVSLESCTLPEPAVVVEEEPCAWT